MTYEDDVTEDMNAILAANPITKERLRCIPNTNTYANSVNVYVGRPRSGKTYLALHDVISVIRNDETAHLLIYINESGQCDDDTFDRFQQLIDTSIIFVKYSDAEKYLRKLLQYKQIYNRIKDNNTYLLRPLPPLRGSVALLRGSVGHAGASCGCLLG